MNLETEHTLKLFSELPIDARVKTMKEIKSVLIECDHSELMSIDEIILDLIESALIESVSKAVSEAVSESNQ